MHFYLAIVTPKYFVSNFLFTTIKYFPEANGALASVVPSQYKWIFPSIEIPSKSVLKFLPSTSNILIVM
ncbi:hypothetical protein D9V84_01875 [Bacteroidetes/Chlorobi group bacterium Naka2016]|nr:MAG: hypothetical protein D9V84_01875 [Bacteroidetes/Chlorobi group bacterium Naka2016]